MKWIKWKLIYAYWYLKLFFYNIFGKTYTASACGHTTKLFALTYVELLKEKLFTSLAKNPKYCPDCRAKMTIRCAWCGKPILVGGAITLYTPSRKDFVVPDYALVYRKNPLQLVGCLRWSCADSGIDRAGFWVEPGEVYRVLSPMELCIQTDAPIIVNDITDINQATPFSSN